MDDARRYDDVQWMPMGWTSLLPLNGGELMRSVVEQLGDELQHYPVPIPSVANAQQAYVEWLTTLRLMGECGEDYPTLENTLDFPTSTALLVPLDKDIRRSALMNLRAYQIRLLLAFLEDRVTYGLQANRSAEHDRAALCMLKSYDPRPQLQTKKRSKSRPQKDGEICPSSRKR